MIKPVQGGDVYYYDRPVVILLDADCFSATDIFLGAFKGWRNVTMMGQPSGGGSGHFRIVRLPFGQIALRLCTMASFLPSGNLYEGRGTAPDKIIKPIATDFIGATDTTLAAAVARIAG
jgi:C-terminal processing protease CtpA/Prc